MPLLTTRETIYLGAWNTCTMWETERVFKIAAEMRKYNLEVLGISETRWTQDSRKEQQEGTSSISRTRAEKAETQAEYTEVNKQVKCIIRIGKRKYVEDLATTAEKATREGNMRQLYDTTKKLSGNRR
ncbi:unnamed protein product [Schistosoma margrebowiei]|uniref:Uncharacterized protein n=1 Tax=Schistosoma margrebowiei TaxID=48269 RepID=A0A183LKV5_9TREM|nr:unnamed protein product [Schistosoma margrebowiei]